MKTDELFAKCIIGDYDDDKAWEAVQELRDIGSREVFDKALLWCRSAEPMQQARGVDIIAQLKPSAEGGHPYAEEAFEITEALLRQGNDPLVLRAAITAAGHLEDERTVPLIARFRSHPDSDVRFSVAWAMGSFANNAIGVETLLLLVNDTEGDVRDWAAFGLGVLGDEDSPDIRDALMKCFNEENEDIREEGLVGLCKRKDLRALPFLLRELREGYPFPRGVEAACFLLDMPQERKDWKEKDYALALQKRFPDVK